MQFTTVAITFAAAVAAVAPNAAAKQQFIDNYVQNAKRAVASGSVAAASASASRNATSGAAAASTSVVKNNGSSTLPTSTSDATVMALSGSALFAGIVALVL